MRAKTSTFLHKLQFQLFWHQVRPPARSSYSRGIPMGGGSASCLFQPAQIFYWTPLTHFHTFLHLLPFGQLGKKNCRWGEGPWLEKRLLARGKKPFGWLDHSAGLYGGKKAGIAPPKKKMDPPPTHHPWDFRGSDAAVESFPSLIFAKPETPHHSFPVNFFSQFLFPIISPRL